MFFPYKESADGGGIPANGLSRNDTPRGWNAQNLCSEPFKEFLRSS
jgi:hypothetical protein